MTTPEAHRPVSHRLVWAMALSPLLMSFINGCLLVTSLNIFLQGFIAFLICCGLIVGLAAQDMRHLRGCGYDARHTRLWLMPFFPWWFLFFFRRSRIVGGPKWGPSAVLVLSMVASNIVTGKILLPYFRPDFIQLRKIQAAERRRDWAAASALSEQTLQNTRDTGIRLGASVALALANINLGHEAMESRDFAAALRFFEKANQAHVPRARQSLALVPTAKWGLARQMMQAGDPWGAKRLLEEAFGLARESGMGAIVDGVVKADYYAQAVLELAIGSQAASGGDIAGAQRFISEAEGACGAAGSLCQGFRDLILQAKSALQMAGTPASNPVANPVAPATMTGTALANVAETQTRASLASLRQALQAFHGRRHRFPKDLSELVSRGYLKQLPLALVPPYHPLIAQVQNQSRQGPVAAPDTGGWGYYDDPASKDFGGVFVNCTHADSAGRRWDSY